MRGRKPTPAALRKGHHEGPKPPDALPRCPAHLDAVARKEWRRLAKPLYDMGVLTVADRGAFAAYCQAWSRWVEAEEQLRKTPLLLKTPSGYVQQSPWLSIANKQMEIMGRFMGEMGLTPSARMRLPATGEASGSPLIVIRKVYAESGEDADANETDTMIEGKASIYIPTGGEKV